MTAKNEIEYKKQKLVEIVCFRDFSRLRWSSSVKNPVMGIQ